MQPGESVRFPAAAEMSERLSALGSRAPAATAYLSLHADCREVAPMGAVLVLLSAATATNRIEALSPDRSDGPMDKWDLMRQLAMALFDGLACEAVVAAVNCSEDRVKE